MAKRAKKTARPVEEPSPLLERLKEIAAASGLEVREERLHREVGYSVRSGVCRLEDHEILLLDRNATNADRIEAICNVLSDRDLESIFIEPELRRAIGGRAATVPEDARADALDGTRDGEGPAAPAA